MLDFSRRELVFKFDGEEQTVRFPSVKDLAKYQEEYAKAEEGKQGQLIIDFLVSLGLKQEVADLLEIEACTAILKELTSVKKN